MQLGKLPVPRESEKQKGRLPLLSLSLYGLPAGLEKKGRRSKPLPSRIATCVGAQVALQRCPILRTGIAILSRLIRLDLKKAMLIIDSKLYFG